MRHDFKIALENLIENQKAERRLLHIRKRVCPARISQHATFDHTNTRNNNLLQGCAQWTCPSCNGVMETLVFSDPATEANGFVGFSPDYNKVVVSEEDYVGCHDITQQGSG